MYAQAEKEKVKAPGIPVVSGQGTPQPRFSRNSPKCNAKEKVVFIGGFQRVHVPFVLAQSTSNYV